MLDALDVDLVRALRESPRAGVLELSRSLGVARGTVSARLDRLERDGVITGYGRVDGRLVAVCAYDFTVMAGSMGMTGEM